MLLLLILNNRYIYRLLAFGTVADFKFDLLSLGQGLETLLYNPREVNENLFAIFTDNESVALFAIEPFNFTSHKNLCLIIIVQQI